jgi:hypothetical protein
MEATVIKARRWLHTCVVSTDKIIRVCTVCRISGNMFQESGRRNFESHTVVGRGWLPSCRPFSIVDSGGAVVEEDQPESVRVPVPRADPVGLGRVPGTHRGDTVS